MCYAIIGIVFFSNLVFLLNQGLIALNNQNEVIITFEAICAFFINTQDIINILFVQRQWITTRRQLYRQSITPQQKEYFRKQIKRHNLTFMGLQVFMLVALLVASIAFYFSNIRSYNDPSCYD